MENPKEPDDKNVVPVTTTPRGSHKSPQAQRIIPTVLNNHRRKEHTQTTNLTRFGLNAYVIGAIRREINCYGRRLQWLAASLNARELQQNPFRRHFP